jgi:hypothetical protein
VAKKLSYEGTVLLQLGVGLFLATLGIAGMTSYNADLKELGRAVNRLFGGKNDPTALVLAVAELVAGVVVVGALLVRRKNRALALTMVVLAALWLAYLVIVAIRTAFEPDFVTWLNQLSVHLLALVALWVVSRRYA